MTSIPRSEWKKHPNYPNQVLLLGSHENFRDISAYLVRESLGAWSASPTSKPRDALLNLFSRWKAAMKSHEAYEEGKLYPFLVRRFRVDPSFLEEEHRRLSVAETVVHRTFKDGDSLAFAHALKEHDKVLGPHLDAEEELVIPLLLSLSPSEFRLYSESR